MAGEQQAVLVARKPAYRVTPHYRFVPSKLRRAGIKEVIDLIARDPETRKEAGFVQVQLIELNGRVSAVIKGLEAKGVQNKGVGTELLRRAEQQARQNGATLAWLKAGKSSILNREGKPQPLEEFYAKRGYKPYYEFDRLDQKYHYKAPYARMAKILAPSRRRELLQRQKQLK
ncbi:MAG TPA: GNAT family N-acetyltransferase [archaeon]|nr:GNAT family N-acetyltransferase [archaeon]